MSITPARVSEASPKQPSSSVTQMSHPGSRPIFPSYFAISTQNPSGQNGDMPQGNAAMKSFITSQHSLSPGAKPVV